VSGQWSGSLAQRIGVVLDLTQRGPAISGSAQFSGDTRSPARAKVTGTAADEDVALRFTLAAPSPSMTAVEGATFEGELSADGTLTGNFRYPAGEPTPVVFKRVH
jgi:hypothetical protein